MSDSEGQEKEDGLVVPTIGTYPSSSVKQIFNNSQPTGDDIIKIHGMMCCFNIFCNDYKASRTMRPNYCMFTPLL